MHTVHWKWATTTTTAWWAWCRPATVGHLKWVPKEGDGVSYGLRTKYNSEESICPTNPPLLNFPSNCDPTECWRSWPRRREPNVRSKRVDCSTCCWCPPLGRYNNSPVECWLLQLTALPWSRKLTLRMTLRPWSSGIAFPGDGERLHGLPTQSKPAINDTDIGVKIPSPLPQDAPENLVGSGWGWTSMKPTTVLKVLPLPGPPLPGRFFLPETIPSRNHTYKNPCLGLCF